MLRLDINDVADDNNKAFCSLTLRYEYIHCNAPLLKLNFQLV